MRRAGGGCPIDGLVGEMFKIGKKFTADETVQKRFGKEADNIFKIIFEDTFNMPIDSLNSIEFTKGTLKTLQRRLNKVKLASNKDKLTSSFGSLFYTPSAIAKNNPQLMKLMDNLHNVNLGFQGRTDRHNRSFRNILDFMKKQMIVDGLGGSMMPEASAGRKLSKITKAANKFEAEIEKLSVDVYNNVLGAKEKLSEALRLENEFYVKGEGKVFKEMLDVIEKDLPDLEFEITKQWWSQKDKHINNLKKGRISRGEYESIRKRVLTPILANKIKSEPMRNAVAEYVDLMGEMHTVLDNGINAYIKSIKEGMRGKYTNETIDDIAKKIKEKISPDKKTGYFPHYRRVLNVDFLDNLMPHMQRVSDAVSESLKSDTGSVDSAIEALNGYVSGRTKSRAVVDLGEGVSAQKEYSRNFFTTLKRYVDEVDRFNMVSHADMYTRQSLNEAKELFKGGKPLNGYGRATVEMMNDMNARMKGGYGFQNENAEMAMKSLLALEFTSKLGFNLRSPFKNASQGLLNFVEFGPITMKKSRDFYNNNRQISLKVDTLMEEAGFLFADNAAPELVEGQMRGKSFTKKIKITDNESVEFKKPGWFTNIYNRTSKVAGFSGKLMAKVENFNRKTTFKTGFYKMYEQLNNSTAYKNELRNRGFSESKIEAEIISRARNYAIRKTTLLHFDYTDLAKSSWLLNPAGRLLGQFQHYGIKFLEYNMDLVKNAGDDVLAGELLGNRAKKAYAMGFTYFLAPAIASSVTGLDFGNIVEHNVKEQINKLWALFTGEEEEIKKAYYGKGVLTGLPFIGAPVISDSIALGNIWEFMDMDNETMELLLTGYEDYALKSKDKKVYETIRLLNVQAGRGFYKTLPLIMSGSPGAALQYELGLYKTKESKQLKDDVKGILPNNILNALAAIESHQKSATSKEGFEDVSLKQRYKKEKSILQEKGYLR